MVVAYKNGGTGSNQEIIFSGYFVGFILTITSYAFLASLMIFFISSSWATKFRSEKKKSLEEDFKKGNSGSS